MVLSIPHIIHAFELILYLDMSMNATTLKSIVNQTIVVLISVILYWFFAYDLVRIEYVKLLTLYALLFSLYIVLIRSRTFSFRSLAIIAFLFRAVFILAIPNLSQDFYRFIWDGRMILEGFNPYLYTPQSFLLHQEFPVAQAELLYEGMGSLNGSHFTNYPPLNQLCFFIASLFTGNSIIGSVVVLRLIIIAADFGVLIYGKKLLNKLGLNIMNIFWYILNPFVIIELTGNLHFEGVMMFFLVLSLYLFHVNKWVRSAMFFACSVSMKLIPLIFLPLYIKAFKKHSENDRIDFVKPHWFYLITGSITLILFLPFYSAQFIHNYTKTVGLWFQKFEFNASVYYVFREIGFLFRGFNEIAIIGKILPVMVILFIIFMAVFRTNSTTRKLITNMLLVMSVYYFTSTTVHPWYISTLLILSVFTRFRFPLIWSFVIVLSYLAYANEGYTENLYLVALEYLIVFSVFLFELLKKKPIEIKRSQNT